MQRLAHIYRKRGIVLMTLLAVFACVVLTVTVFYPTNPSSRAVVYGKGLPDDAKITALIESSGQFYELTSENGTIETPAPLAKMLKQPYRVSATIGLPSDQYRDIDFIAANNTLSVMVDGFHAGDRVSLEIDGHTVYKRVPADWSGKIELSAPESFSKKRKSCVKIAGEAEAFSLCHVVPEGRTS